MSKFDVKNKIDDWLYATYNTVADVLFFLKRDIRKVTAGNARFIRKETGGRCFIVGTGPSLKSVPDELFNLMSKEYCFGVNFLYKSEVFNKVKPNYYVLMDDYFWGEYSNTFSEICNKYDIGKPVFITDYRAKDLLNDHHMFLHAKNYPVNNVRLDLCGNSSALMNVVSYSIAAAMFMGFKEIYLVGCDYNAFSTNGIGHCYDDDDLKESGLNLAYFLKFYHITTEFHYLLAKEAKKNGVKIINITDGSLLDAYPRVSYKKIDW
ncbi:hypothetical protein [Alkalimarinus sediminis]|uniref:DUF115 domain-containing protein n=1 Tax=Alkalimarinus sediminis TaxID=1632866 RepID=A0A9E8HPF2_9ALTE|nr:hypothetical protein [Alkalimarinus sediminis]UZW73424.1 hypothetical protein NNL22_10215 [Alkalimarinus sediminis]